MAAALADLLREHATAAGVPGAVIGVLRQGEHEVACHGVADVRTGTAVTESTPFAVGSLTKSMLATVVVGLAAEGRVALDEPVASYVPEVRAFSWARSATVRSLMANRSGLPLSVATEFDFEGRPEDDAAALGRLVADLGPGSATGGSWSYSNAGWCVLGRLVEIVTSSSWETAMRDRLASGGLHRTSYDVASASRAAVGHRVTPDGAVPIDALRSRAYAPAGTTTVSTVGDLLRLAAWHLRDPVLAALREVQDEVRINGWLDAWCLGWARFDWTPRPAWGWDGLLDGQRAFLRLLPADDAALVLLTNADSGRAAYRTLVPRLATELFGIDVPAPHTRPMEGAAGELGRFAGDYAWPDRCVSVRVAGTCLVVDDGDRVVEAPPVDDRSFLVDPADPDNPTVTFGSFDAKGRPGTLYEMLWGLPRATGREACGSR